MSGLLNWSVEVTKFIVCIFSAETDEVGSHSSDRTATCEQRTDDGAKNLADQRHRHSHDSDSDPDVPRQRSRAHCKGGTSLARDGASSGERDDSKSDRSAERCSVRRHDSDSDLSLVRASGHGSEKIAADQDNSPKRAAKQSSRRQDSDSDLSPFRPSGHGPRRNIPDTGRSPKRAERQTTGRHDSDSDISPVRSLARGFQKHADDMDYPSKKSSKRSTHRRDSDADLSPPRDRSRVVSKSTNRRHDSDSDLSPPRPTTDGSRRSPSSDLSPVRVDQNSDRPLQQPAILQHRHSSSRERSGDGRSSKVDSDGDLSPRRQPRGGPPSKRGRNDSDSDLSPPRGGPSRTVGGEERSKVGKVTKTLSGAQAGLQLAADMRKESQELKRRDDASFAKVRVTLIPSV